mgnify:CR=1 FL=1
MRRPLSLRPIQSSLPLPSPLIPSPPRPLSSRRYIVLIVWPLLLGLPSLALHGAPGAALDWRPERGTRFYVIDKEPGGAGHVATFK